MLRRGINTIRNAICLANLDIAEEKQFGSSSDAQAAAFYAPTPAAYEAALKASRGR
jgi:hypothetical protein